MLGVRAPDFQLVSASLGPPNLVVVVPPRYFGNPLVTSGTQPLLLLPESKQLSFPPESAFHFYAKALFKIHLPFGVKGVGCPLDFRMSFEVLCARKSRTVSSKPPRPITSP